MVNGVQCCDVEPFDEADQPVGVLRVGGIAVLLQCPRPGFVVHDIQLEEVGIPFPVGQEERMVVVGILHGGVLAEALLQLVVIDQNRVAVPLMAFDAEMVVALRGQTAFAAGALEDALRHRDAGRNLVLVHLLHRHIGVLLYVIPDVLLVVLRENRNTPQQTSQQTYYFLHILRIRYFFFYRAPALPYSLFP